MSLLNYLPFITMRNAIEMPKILQRAISKLEVAQNANGPVWNPVMNAAIN